MERKRSLFVSAYVVVFVLFFAAIFYYGWKERERTVREKDIVSEHKDTKERAMPENGRENSSALEHEETGADTMEGRMQQEQEAAEIAKNDMGVTFMDVDVQVFKDAVADVQQNMLEDNPDIADLYEHIQKVNAQYEGKGDD